MGSRVIDARSLSHTLSRHIGVLRPVGWHSRSAVASRNAPRPGAGRSCRIGLSDDPASRAECQEAGSACLAFAKLAVRLQATQCKPYDAMRPARDDSLGLCVSVRIPLGRYADLRKVLLVPLAPFSKESAMRRSSVATVFLPLSDTASLTATTTASRASSVLSCLRSHLPIASSTLTPAHNCE